MKRLNFLLKIFANVKLNYTTKLIVWFDIEVVRITANIYDRIIESHFFSSFINKYYSQIYTYGMEKLMLFLKNISKLHEIHESLCG